MFCCFSNTVAFVATGTGDHEALYLQSPCAYGLSASYQLTTNFHLIPCRLPISVNYLKICISINASNPLN